MFHCEHVRQVTNLQPKFALTILVINYKLSHPLKNAFAETLYLELDQNCLFSQYFDLQKGSKLK